MKRKMDLTGNVYGKLTVLSEAPKVKIKRRWTVRCECGKEYDVDGDTLTCRNVKACSSCAKIIHGQSSGGPNKHKGTRSYRAWDAMMGRCYNSKHKSYMNYGGRGITVCERWHTFINFYEDVGDPPSDDSSFDRINNDGHYEPSNWRWTTMDRQIWNQRKRKNSKNPYKGVYETEEGNFRARVWLSKSKSENLGVYKTAEEAAKAVDKRYLELRGEDARLNLP